MHEVYLPTPHLVNFTPRPYDESMREPTDATKASFAHLEDVNWADFDGNLTMDIKNWMFPNEVFKTASPEILVESLMGLTIETHHLAWVVFPPPGYRVVSIASPSPGWETGDRQLPMFD